MPQVTAVDDQFGTHTAKPQKDIYDEMTALYPDWVSHQSWLMSNFP